MKKQFTKTTAMLLFVVLMVGIFAPIHQARALPMIFTEVTASAMRSLYEAATSRGSVVQNMLGNMFATLAPLLNQAIGSSGSPPAAIYEMWKIIRNLVNIFFILVLIVMAFGTIFSIPHLAFRDLFVSFLIAALLVNFSYAIGTYIIDISNSISDVFLNTLRDGLNNGNAADLFREGFSIQNATSNASFLDKAADCLSSFNQCLVRTTLDIIVALIMLMVSSLATLVVVIFLLLRGPALWILLFMSPVAWLGYSLPKIRKQTWNFWWDHFLGWVFWLPSYIFILMMLGIILGARKEVAETWNPAVGNGHAAYGTINDLMFFIISLLFIAGGIWASFQVGKMFNGGAGMTANWIQKKIGGAIGGAVGKVPIPFGGGRYTNISEVAGGAKETWQRIQKEGLPHEGPLGKLRFLYSGKEAKETGIKNVSQSLTQRLGYGSQAEGVKAEISAVDHQLEQLKNDVSLGRTSADKIKADIEQGSARMMDTFGRINPEMVAKYKFMAENGNLSKKEFLDLIRALGSKNPMMISNVAESAKKSNFRNMGDTDLIDLMRKGGDLDQIVATAPDTAPGIKAAEKQLYQYIISEDGKKRVDLIAGMDAGIYKHGLELFGGDDTEAGRGFKKQVASVRPDLVAENIAREKYSQTQKADGTTIFVKTSDIDKPGRKEYTTRYDAMSAEQRSLLEGNTASEVAGIHANAWNNDTFLQGLAEQILTLQARNPAEGRNGRWYDGSGSSFMRNIEELLRTSKGAENKLASLQKLLDKDVTLNKEQLKRLGFENRESVKIGELLEKNKEESIRYFHEVRGIKIKSQTANPENTT